MGNNHLWRKNSYVKVDHEDPGCVWKTVLKVLSYHHPWHNVKKMLPYKKEKSHKKGRSMSSEQIDYIKPQVLELEDDSMSTYSASVHSSPSRGGSRRKKSIKAKIKALLAYHGGKSVKVNSIQEHELLALRDECADLSAPTLISLLKANPKLIKAVTSEDESSKSSRGKSLKHKDFKDEYVGVLELFKVDQDLLRKVLKSSPPRRPRLTKSGSFPSARCSQIVGFGRNPSKLEHKHTEVWPVTSPSHELRKTKSQNIERSSSLKDSVDRYNNLIDTTSSNKKGFKKHLSKSLKVTIEKDFVLLGDLHGRKSFRERLYVTDNESDTPRASLDSFLQQMFQGEGRGHSLTSPRTSFSPCKMSSLAESYANASPRAPFSPGKMSTLAESHVNDTRSDLCVDQQGESAEVMKDNNCDTDDRLTSVSGTELCSFQVEEVDWPILDDSITMSPSTYTVEEVEDIEGPIDRTTRLEHEVYYNNADLQYVKYVLDIIGFTTVDDQFGAWHSADQPLDPALFDGIEVCCPFETKSEETITSSYHRKLLFDLINEALFDVHEKSYAYYPKALSSFCNVHPVPRGRNQVVQKVWEYVSQYLDWQPERDCELNFAVAHEMSRLTIGWTNLQTDTELLAIDLEDWIFNELVEEFVC